LVGRGEGARHGSFYLHHLQWSDPADISFDGPVRGISAPTSYNLLMLFIANFVFVSQYGFKAAPRRRSLIASREALALRLWRSVIPIARSCQNRDTRRLTVGAACRSRTRDAGGRDRGSRQRARDAQDALAAHSELAEPKKLGEKFTLSTFDERTEEVETKASFKDARSAG
jgi:hypothetical protein